MLENVVHEDREPSPEFGRTWNNVESGWRWRRRRRRHPGHFVVAGRHRRTGRRSKSGKRRQSDDGKRRGCGSDGSIYSMYRPHYIKSLVSDITMLCAFASRSLFQQKNRFPFAKKTTWRRIPGYALIRFPFYRTVRERKDIGRRVVPSHVISPEHRRELKWHCSGRTERAASLHGTASDSKRTPVREKREG